MLEPRFVLCGSPQTIWEYPECCDISTSLQFTTLVIMSHDGPLVMWEIPIPLNFSFLYHNSLWEDTACRY
jgi:hypothetical protein